MSHVRGYTRSELLATLAVLVVLMAIVFVILGRERRYAEDAHRMRSIHESLILFGEDRYGLYPRPGVIWREQSLEQAHQAMGRWIPISILPDATKNTTANLYSFLTMQEYIAADVPISPRDRNPHVQPIRSYDYSVYDPAGNVHWDTSFKADLTSESHTSYAHLLLHGARGRLLWRSSGNPDTPILGNRGPRDGLPDADSFTTRRNGSWAGYVVFTDNSVRWLRTMTPEQVRYEPNIAGQLGPPVPDNIFAAEFEDDWPNSPLGSNDAFLTFTLDFVGQQGRLEPVIQHD